MLLLLRSLEWFASDTTDVGVDDPHVFWWSWFFVLAGISTMFHVFHKDDNGKYEEFGFAVGGMVPRLIIVPLLAVFAVGKAGLSLAGFIASVSASSPIP